MKIDKVISIIESFAEPSYQASWDLSGVQVASKKEDIYKIALCLDPTPVNLTEALKWKADLVLCHHPITLSPKLPNVLDLYHEILSICLKEDLWLYAAHTSLDVQLKGPVSWLAQEFLLEDIRPIEPTDDNSDIGFGVIGKVPKDLKFEDFILKLKSILKIDHWLESGNRPSVIRTIAYCPGSGMSLASKAFSKGADVFISGELKHHDAIELEKVGFIIDVGHFVLEEKMMEIWAEELKNSLKEVEVKFFKQKQPIKYI